MRDRSICRLCCLAVAIVLSGCQSNARPAQLDQARRAYDAGQYVQAEAVARDVMNSATGPARAEAAYLAGLSSYRMGSTHTAETNFLIAAGSSDAQIAGRAKAMLGMIRLRQNRPSEAATLFAQAEPVLQGEDARMLAKYAAIANQQAGNFHASHQWTMKVAPGGSGGSSQAAGPVFALQVGAFRERDRAERAAEDARGVADPQNLGPVRIVASADDRGRRLYLVQFGSFGSRAAAAVARQRLGRLQYIVTPAGS